jgi:hypothetical protein
VGKHGYAFLIFAVSIFFLLASSAESAGLFTGAEVDDESQRFLYAGAQTDGKYFLQIFAADLNYDFKDNGIIREATSKWITPAIGFRTRGSLSLSVVAGPTFREKKEEQSSGTTTVRDSGGFFQVGGYFWKEDMNIEFLASYTNLDNFLWGRLRAKKRIRDSFFMGAEVFGMGNQDFNGWGVGPLLELRKGKAAFTLKAGYKNTTTYGGGLYAGLELYTAF